jgi:tagatose 6-phosphate kinase
LEARPYLIKPNKEELESILDFKLNSEDDFFRAAEILQKKGARNIAISLGGKGMYYFSENDFYKVKVPKVKVLNATGSGDSVIAGFAVALKKKMEIEDMLKLANACGISNVVEKETGFIKPDNVENYFKLVEISS